MRVLWTRIVLAERKGSLNSGETMRRKIGFGAPLSMSSLPVVYMQLLSVCLVVPDLFFRAVSFGWVAVGKGVLYSRLA